jgi:hypothetical protein
MKWDKTVASSCRYGEVAGRIWGDWDVLWEDSEADWQGHASFLATKDGKYAVYEWWYGSCGGCDGWEADGADDDRVEKEMRRDAQWFKSKKAFLAYVDKVKKAMEGADGDVARFDSNADMKRGGGIAFGIDFLGGGLRGRLEALIKAVEREEHEG